MDPGQENAAIERHYETRALKQGEILAREKGDAARARSSSPSNVPYRAFRTFVTYMSVEHSGFAEQLVDNSADAFIALAVDGIPEITQPALSDSEERYRELVENAGDIIYSHDLEGNYTAVNRAGEQITGYTREEVLKLNMAQAIIPEDLEKAYEMMRRKLAGETISPYQIEILAKDGHRIAVEVNTRLIRRNHVPVAIQGIARDITARKLFEEQLRQSQKMEAIEQLVGEVAHDFNNLLTAIKGYSSLALQRTSPDDRIHGYLKEIKKAGDRAANLTQQLLASGRKQMPQLQEEEMLPKTTTTDTVALVEKG